jgi:predicted nucleotidyltransferase component of viral defense system
MKAYLRELCAAKSPLQARQLVREYLQARILQSLQRAGAMHVLAFHGGTALRFLFEIPRFSEDLDFALERAPEAYDFRAYLRQIERDLAAEAYEVAIKLSDKRIVNNAFVQFRGLLHELGLSGHTTEVLAIKLEIDTNPPDGAVLETTVLNRYVALNLQHHDRASLLAGKLHAVLQRPYPKGRDIYDLWWYLTQPDWPEPNLTQLNNALVQSDWSGSILNDQNWRYVVQERIAELDWDEQVIRDVRPFIMTPGWEDNLPREVLLAHLS